MRYLFGFVCALALGLMGCSETTGTGGSGGTGARGGDGGTGGVTGQEFPCTEEGINDAIAEGGGPHTFDCNGAETVRTGATISVNNDVILDGQGNITLEPKQDEEHPVFWVHEGVTAELRGFTMTGGNAGDGGGIVNNGDSVIVDCSIRDNAAGDSGGGIMNSGTLTITDSTITGNTALGNGGGIENIGTLTLTDCTVSENRADDLGGGIRNLGNLTVTNSTISANSADAGGAITNGTVAVATMTNTTVSENSTMSEQLESAAIDNFRGFGDAGSLTMVNCTVSGNTGGGIAPKGPVRLSSTIVGDDCREGDIGITSLGFNIESPGDTCDLDPDPDGTDRVNVTVEQLNLGALANNGGPTMTHKPGDGGLREGSVAIDQIPEADCEVGTDQRGQPRPAGPDPKRCDVGSLEVQGSIKSGLWLGGNPASNTDGTPFDTGWAICFNVNEDGTALTPSTDCDIDGNDDEAHVLELSWKNDVGAGTVQGEVGICNANPEEGSESIGIGDSYPFEDAFGVGAVGVPIEDSSFAIPLGFLFPDVEITGGEIQGTFNGDTASGTATWTWSPGMGFSQCELDGGWTAAPAP